MKIPEDLLKELDKAIDSLFNKKTEDITKWAKDLAKDICNEEDNMNEKRIGQCSICKGDVVQITIWFGVGPPPRPYCKTCGAVMQLPTIPMMPMERQNGYNNY